jgi:hypothetical protein
MEKTPKALTDLAPKVKAPPSAKFFLNQQDQFKNVGMNTGFLEKVTGKICFSLPNYMALRRRPTGSTASVG